jgi:hypothetical protein
VNQIAVWAENPTICQILWAPKNGLLMMEILRQSAMMPVKDYHATIKRSADTFRLFLMVRVTSLLPTKVVLSKSVHSQWLCAESVADEQVDRRAEPHPADLLAPFHSRHR